MVVNQLDGLMTVNQRVEVGSVLIWQIERSIPEIEHVVMCINDRKLYPDIDKHSESTSISQTHTIPSDSPICELHKVRGKESTYNRRHVVSSNLVLDQTASQMEKYG